MTAQHCAICRKYFLVTRNVTCSSSLEWRASCRAEIVLSDRSDRSVRGLWGDGGRSRSRQAELNETERKETGKG
eukprot:1499439-Rhodomonas_salina.3